MTDVTGWRTARLDELCDINPPKPSLNEVDGTTEVLFVPMASVDEVSGTVARPEQSTIDAVGRKSYRSFTAGDILFAKITPCMENGKSAVVPPIATGYGFGSTEFHVLRPKASTNGRLIWHLVRQRAFRNEAANHFTGTVGQLRVPADFLRSFQMSIPTDSEEQALLADVLDLATAKALSAVSRLALASRAIERFRQAVLAAACCGRLTAGWRIENAIGAGGELVDRVTEERRAHLGRRFHELPTEIDAMPEIPESWAWASSAALCEPDRVITYGVVKLGPPVEDGVPTLRSSDVRWLHIDSSSVKRISHEIAGNYKRTYLKGGEILVTVRGTLGGVAVAPPEMSGWNVSREVAVIPLSQHLDADYCALCIANMHSQRWLTGVAKGVAYTGVNIEDLRKLPMPIPPIAEQREIVRVVSQLLKSAGTLLARIDAAGHQVDRTSQAVLAKAFRGELSA